MLSGFEEGMNLKYEEYLLLLVDTEHRAEMQRRAFKKIRK